MVIDFLQQVLFQLQHPLLRVFQPLQHLFSLALRICFSPFLILVLVPSSIFAASTIPSDIAKTSVSHFELALQLLIQVPFFSFTSNTSSSTLWEISFHFTRGFELFYLSCELCPPSSTGERCQFVFESQSFDDHPALFLVIAFFSTARFFFTLDIDLLGEGEEEGRIETHMSWLHIKGVIRVSSSQFPFTSNKSNLSPSPSPSFSCPHVNLSPVTWSRQFSPTSRNRFSGCASYRR